MYFVILRAVNGSLQGGYKYYVYYENIKQIYRIFILCFKCIL